MTGDEWPPQPDVCPACLKEPCACGEAQELNLL